MEGKEGTKSFGIDHAGKEPITGVEMTHDWNYMD